MSIDVSLRAKRVLFVVNNPDFFVSHRLPLGVGARSAGYEVHIAAPEGQGAPKLRAMGFHYHTIHLSRSGTSLLTEFRSFMGLLRLYHRLRPDIVHHVTIKPVLYGTFAARLAGLPAVVNAFSGLGYVFTQRGWRSYLRRSLVNFAYRIFLKHPRQIAIFQNRDDLDQAVESGWVKRKNTVMIRGSGVDLNLFRVKPETTGPLLVVLPARLLLDKGVREFAEAARLLHKGSSQTATVRFALVGSPDAGNPASVTSEWVESVVSEGVLEAWGHRDDMRLVFSEAHIVCLPSYREGLPKALIEAAACGRAIVTTNVPGCREVIRDGEGGFLVPPRDSAALGVALQRLIQDGKLRAEMGLHNRREAEANFDVEIVVRDTLDIYKRLR